MDEQIESVRRAMARDSDAFIAVTDTVKHKLYHTARAILGNEADACEALDETMFKAWRGIHKLKLINNQCPFPRCFLSLFSP